MKIKYSCLIDKTPIFRKQAYIFVNSLLELVNVSPNDIYVHTTFIEEGDFFNWLNQLGVNIIKIEEFDFRNKYCNKLAQLSTFQNLKEYDYVFLMDCDTALISLEGLDLKGDVYAKIVDFPNPPLSVLKDIYKAAELEFVEAETTFSLENKHITAFNNCNGGLYIFSKQGLNDIAPKWKEYALWSIENAKLFTEKYEKHADQVGFSLALSSLNKNVNHLGIEWNYPIHMSSKLLSNINPKIIHFHNELTGDFNIKYKGVKSVDVEILKLNNLINYKNIKEESMNHVRDISDELLKRAYLEVKRPDLLQYLVDVSRKNFKFYTSHYPRVFEYSWLLDQVENEKGKSILDIGAGVCPLPLCLTEMGLNVTTIDSHPNIRKIDKLENWNEWGFLNYKIFNKKIKSYNMDFIKFRSFKKFDFIYSISVIEHIPKKNRLKLLKRAAKLLKKNGELLFTIDLIPNTNKLWNLSEDKEVDIIEEHGTIESFKKELNKNGFKIIEDEIQREIDDSRTDIYYVKAILEKKKFI